MLHMFGRKGAEAESHHSRSTLLVLVWRFERDARVIFRADVRELERDVLSKSHGAAQVLVDGLPALRMPVGQMAAGLSAAEGRSLGKEVQRRPRADALGRPADEFH